VFAFLLGQLLSWAEAQGRRPPAYFGWELVIISLAAALAPKDGFWLVLIPAFMIAGGPKDSEATAAKTGE